MAWSIKKPSPKEEKRMTPVGNSKITIGFVVQTFNPDGECIAQEFIAGDQVEWENENGESIETPEHEYQEYNMVQPPRCWLNHTESEDV